MSADNKHIKHYSAADIQRYLNGQMTAAEKHAMEKAALEDAFLAEALEGYWETSRKSVTSDMAELEKRLQQRSEAAIVPLYQNRRLWWAVAAALMLIAGTATTWYLFNQKPTHDIAQKTKEITIPSVASDEATKSADERKAPEAPLLNEPTDKEQEQANQVLVKPNKKAQEKDSFAAVTDKPSAGIAAAPRSVVENTKLSNPAGKEADENFESSKKDRAAIAAKAEAMQGGRENELYINTHVFKGKIANTQNQPLPFVNISAAGINTYTDVQGNFTILSGDTVLNAAVKSVGYERKNVVLTSNMPSNNITLAAGKNALSEVVVAGYGAKKTKSLRKQDKNEEEDVLAEPVDGWGNYDIYLSNNKRLPSENNKISGGFTEVSFTVNTAGFLYDFKIEKSTCSACNREAIRLIKEGPKWKLTNDEIQSGRMVVNIQF
ncbi:MAG: carboxypeptidase-like regulatory domain-containing protein [Bacteroidetes bacterium]|nr:carboxypeptidase-like regulatory domain-containing protein [Bacteroidota bacterium]